MQVAFLDSFDLKSPQKYNAISVAFFGDTSDENNTDSEQILRDLGTGPRDERGIPTGETRLE